MNAKKTIVLAALSTAIATPALAGIPEAPWDGFYAGAEMGYSWGTDDIHDQSLSSGNSDYSDNFDVNGVTGGLVGGYNYTFGAWLVGAEADIELTGIDGDNSDWPFGDKSTAKIRTQGSLRARAGYVLDSIGLVYVTGGLALADIKTEYFDGAARDSYSDTVPGWTVGAGFEHAFGPYMVGRLEYRYTDFNRVSDDTTNTDSGWQEHNDITQNAVRVALLFRF